MNQRVAIAIEEIGGREVVAEHFGRCTKFTVNELNVHQAIVTTKTYFNPLTGQRSGACQLPGYLNQFNITAIISGGMGQKAVTKFFQFGINVVTAPGLGAEEALSLFRQGTLSGYEPCLHEHRDTYGHACS